MKNLAIISVLLLSGSFVAHAATETLPTIRHKIVGKWQWTRSTNNCTEEYDYRTDGTLYTKSGAEETSNTYSISERPDANGFYELKAQLVKSNGAQDCSDGPPNNDTAPFTIYILFHKAQPLYLVCQTPALDQCFGPLRRVQP